MSGSVRPGQKIVQGLARFGYVAKGVIYLVVGILSLMAALGFAGGQVTGTDSAIHIIAGPAPGRIGFALLTVGLGAHVFWRLYQALVDPSGKGHGPIALIKRGGYAISGLFYLSLMMVSASALTGLLSNGDRSDEAADHLLAFTGGSLAIGLAGLGIVGTGGYQLYRAWKQPWLDHWQSRGLSRQVMKILAGLSSFSIAVRAGLFFLMGWHLMRAGWFSSADEIIDLGAALWAISSETFGGALLAVTSAGLLLYGVYCFLNSVFRRISP